jgi:hypothetical protein
LLFELELRFGENERARPRSASQCVQANAFLAEALGEAKDRQDGEGTQRFYAPAVENFDGFGGDGQYVDRQVTELLGLFACGNYGDAVAAACGDDCGVDVGGDADICIYPQVTGALRKLLRDVFV